MAVCLDKVPLQWVGTGGLLGVTNFSPQVPLVIKALQRQLKDRSVRARQGCFSLLTELASVLPGSLADHMPVLVAGRMDQNEESAVLASF